MKGSIIFYQVAEQTIFFKLDTTDVANTWFDSIKKDKEICFVSYCCFALLLFISFTSSGCFQQLLLRNPMGID